MNQRIKRVGLLLGVAVAGAAAPRALATPSYLTSLSTATFTHDPDVNVAGVPALSSTLVGSGTLTTRSNPKTFVPTSTTPTPPSYQFATTDTRPSSAGNSVAKASVAHVTNATTAAVKIASGTGVTQTSNVATAYSGASELRIDVDIFWDITSTNSFGPPASGIASFAVGGKVGVGAGSFAQFESVINFIDPLHPGTTYRSPINLSDTWIRGDADVAADGTFSKSFADSALLNLPAASLTPGSRLELKGYILFRARSLPVTTVASLFATDFATDSLNATDAGGVANDGNGNSNGLGPDGQLDCNDPPEHGHIEQGDGKGHDPDNSNGQGNSYGWHQGHLDGCDGGPLPDDLETFVGFPQDQLLGGAHVFGEPQPTPEPATAALALLALTSLAATLVARTRFRRA